MPEREQPKPLEAKEATRVPSREELSSVLEYRLEDAQAARAAAKTKEGSDIANRSITTIETTQRTLTYATKEGESVLAGLERTTTPIHAEWQAAKTAQDRDRLGALLTRLAEAKKFVDGEMRSPTTGEPRYKEWERKREAGKLEQQRKEFDELHKKLEERQRKEHETTAAKIEKVYQDLGVESPTEREKSREKATELVLQDGGVRIHTSVERSLSARGDSGFQNLETRIRDGRQPVSARGSIEGQLLSRDDVMRRKGLDDVLKEYGIKEIIDIRHDTQPIYDTVTIPGKKGVLGIGKTPDRTERRATGRYKPILHSEIVSGGKKEPSVRFTYLIPQSEWRDYSGRKGQMMSVEIVLPESTAKEVEQTLEHDPAAMRSIVERVMKEKLLKDPKAWETPQGSGDSLRPPYDKWDAEPNGGKIYVQKEGADPGFHEESVRKVKK